jgi:predicted nucleic acid-binding protein
LAYVDGVVDVGIIVPICFQNPLKDLAADFLAETLLERRRAIIPVTSIIGAYHVATRYLRAPKLAVKKVLEGLLRTRSPALYGQVLPEVAEDALNYAAAYRIESWDGYLIALARSLGAKTVYSIDEELEKVPEVSINNPFPSDRLSEYHKYIRKKLEDRSLGI